MSSNERREGVNKFIEHAKFRFECQRCAACCSDKIKGNVYLSIDELFNLANKLDMTLQELLNKHIEFREETATLDDEKIIVKMFCIKLQYGTCPFLKKNDCTVYDVRPFFCTQYPFWDEIFREENEIQANYKEVCPGLGKGPVFSEEEIEKRLKEDEDYRLKVLSDSKFLDSLNIEGIIKKVMKNVKGANLDDTAKELLKKRLLLEGLQFYKQAKLNDKE